MLLTLVAVWNPIPSSAYFAVCTAECEQGDDQECSGSACSQNKGIGCCGSGGFKKCAEYEGPEPVCENDN